MGKNLIDFICCKLGKKKETKEAKSDCKSLTEDEMESAVTPEKEIEKQVLYQLKEIKNEFDYLINSIIRKYINDIIYKLMKENEKINEEQVTNALGWFVNTSYKDMIKEMKDWVNKNNKELIENISNIIKEYMQLDLNENSDFISKEINKIIDKCMPSYIMQIKKFTNNQIKSLKDEIDKSIGGQLVLTNREFDANNINIVVLEKKLKKYTNEIMIDFSVKNKKQFSIILENISEDFRKIKEELCFGKNNKEVEKKIDEFKEIYSNPLQRSIDQTLEIAKALNK